MSKTGNTRTRGVKRLYRRITLRSLVAFLPVAVSAVLLWAFLLGSQKNRLLEDTLETLEVSLALAEQKTRTRLDHARHDLNHLVHLPLLRSGWHEDGSLDPRHRSAILESFLGLTTLEIYDQIRLLDASGTELIRVNYSSSGMIAVPEQNLQDKSNRYYYLETIQLEDGEVYVSRFDLNIEQGRIEEPHKPMIRLASPIRDEAGRLLCVVILNYMGNLLLEELAALSSGLSCGSLSLLDEEGYWLMAPRPGRCWGFMYDEGRDWRFDAEDPAAWAAIGAGGKPRIQTGKGWYGVRDVPLRKAADNGDPDGSPPALLLVSRLGADELRGLWLQALLGSLPPLLLFLLFVYTLSWFAAKRAVVQRIEAKAARTQALLGKQRLEDLEQELHNREAELRLYLDNVPVVVYRRSREGKHWTFTHISENARKMLGFSPDRMVSEDFWHDGVYREDINPCGLPMEERLAKHPTLEFRLRKDDGGRIWVRDHIRPLRRVRGTCSNASAPGQTSATRCR